MEGEFRLDYARSRALLVERLGEKAPGRIQLLTGPRQVGKTTLLLELASQFGDAALYAAADAPDAGLPGFWDRIWAGVEDRARIHGTAILFLDEVQHVADWAERLKGEWDRLRHRHVPVHVVASGSSALRIRSGSRETLAGRFERITLTHWPASALVDLLGISSGEAPDLLVRFGSYPGALPLRTDVARWRAYVRDAIIEPAIGRDLLALRAVRKPALLRQVFALCATMPCQIVSLQKLQRRLRDPGALETIAHYLELLEEAYLVAAAEKFSMRPIRQRSAPPKIVVLDNALLAAMAPEGIADPETSPSRFGEWVENACLAHAWNAGQRVTYWREAPLEVDAIFDGSWGSWAVEVKTGAFDRAAVEGLLEFCRRHPRYRPLLLTGSDAVGAGRRLGVETMPWREFLMKGPPAT
jgi:hypothetical protein